MLVLANLYHARARVCKRSLSFKIVFQHSDTPSVSIDAMHSRPHDWIYFSRIRSTCIPTSNQRVIGSKHDWWCTYYNETTGALVGKFHQKIYAFVLFLFFLFLFFIEIVFNTFYFPVHTSSINRKPSRYLIQFRFS